MHGIELRRLLLSGIGVAALVSFAAACGDDDDDGADDVGGASTVAVTLKEFEVLTDKDSVPAGSVTFRATNDGPDDPHELVVVKTDLAPDKLPTSDNGAADEEGAGVELIGEIEEFAVGGEEEATFDLTPGKYVLLCNVYDEEEVEAHYAEGMRTAFTVE